MISTAQGRSAPPTLGVGIDASQEAEARTTAMSSDRRETSCVVDLRIDPEYLRHESVREGCVTSILQVPGMSRFARIFDHRAQSLQDVNKHIELSERRLELEELRSQAKTFESYGMAVPEKLTTAISELEAAIAAVGGSASVVSGRALLATHVAGSNIEIRLDDVTVDDATVPFWVLTVSIPDQRRAKLFATGQWFTLLARSGDEIAFLVAGDMVDYCTMSSLEDMVHTTGLACINTAGEMVRQEVSLGGDEGVELYRALKSIG